MKQSIARAGVLSLAILAAAGIANAEPSVFPTGVTRYDTAKAYGTYVLFCGADNLTHLIDMDGNEVHRWVEKGLPSVALDPALVGGQKGHVLVQTSQAAGGGTANTPGVPAIFGDKTVGEVDWNDKVVWNWGPASGAARQHHDIRRLPNGNTLILYNRITHLPGFTGAKQLDDAVEEVTPAGKVTWNWAIGDHLNELGFTAEELNLLKTSGNTDYLHINNMTPLGPNQWFTAGDQRFNPDNILIDSRNANFIIIIDKKTGHVVWRLGPDYPALTKSFAWSTHKIPRPVDQLSGQHDAHLIEPGLPGAGDLLVFDNQGPAGYPSVALSATGGSRVLEIDPVKKQIVWEYSAASSHQPPWAFASSFISSARRLPNGNTLIDEGINGRFIQVTPAGEIVWEYVSPFKGAYLSADLISNWVYRAQPVPYDWAPAGTPHPENPIAGAGGS